MQNESSGANTVLIALVLVVLVGGVVWFFTQNGLTTDQPGGGASAGIDVNLNR